MDKIVIQKANQYRICKIPHTTKNKIVIYNQTYLLPKISWSLPSWHLLGKQIFCYCNTFMSSIVHDRKQYIICMCILCIVRVSCLKLIRQNHQTKHIFLYLKNEWTRWSNHVVPRPILQKLKMNLATSQSWYACFSSPLHQITKIKPPLGFSSMKTYKKRYYIIFQT